MERTTVGGFLESMADKSPAPGGGAAASLAGATSSALAAMVVQYSLGKKNLTPHAEAHQAALEKLTTARADLLALADEDAAAYAALNLIQKRPADDPARLADEPAAIQRATAAPMLTMQRAAEILTLLESLIDNTNPYLRSDLAIAAVLAEAACAAAAWNVRINAPALPEADRPAVLEQAAETVQQAGEARRRIENGCV